MKKIVFPKHNFLFLSENITSLIAKHSRSCLAHLFLDEVILSTYLSGIHCTIPLSIVSLFSNTIKSIAQWKKCAVERWYILSWTSLSVIHGGCNSLLAFPFGPSSLDFRACDIYVYVRECSPGTWKRVGGQWMEYRSGVNLSSSSWDCGAPFSWSLHDIAQVSSLRTYHDTTFSSKSLSSSLPLSSGEIGQVTRYRPPSQYKEKKKQQRSSLL